MFGPIALHKKFRKMKILYVVSSLRLGGAESIAVKYASQLHKRGFELAILEVWHYDTILYRKAINSGVTVYSLLKNSSLWLRFYNKIYGKFRIIAKMSDAIRTFQPNIIHFHYASPSLKLLQIDWQKVVMTFHSDLSRLFKNSPNLRPAIMEMQRRGMHIIVLTDKMKGEAIAECLNANVSVIPNGIDLSNVAQTRYEKSRFCNELGIPTESFIIGHVGRYNVVKNHDRLIKVFKVCVSRNPLCHLVLVGSGSIGESRCIKRLVSKSGVSNNIHLLGEREDAKALMSCFDTFLLTSLAESFSLVLIEAQAHAVRCVASDVVPSDVICNSNCFSLSLEASDEEWANYVLGTNVREGTCCSDITRFDINKVIDSHIALYKNIDATIQEE